MSNQNEGGKPTNPIEEEPIHSTPFSVEPSSSSVSQYVFAKRKRSEEEDAVNSHGSSSSEQNDEHSGSETETDQLPEHEKPGVGVCSTSEENEEETPCSSAAWMARRDPSRENVDWSQFYGYKCYFDDLISFVNGIKDSLDIHTLEILYSTPFGNFYRAIIDNKIDCKSVTKCSYSVIDIIGMYIGQGNTFSLTGKDVLVQLKPEDVALMFGIMASKVICGNLEKKIQETQQLDLWKQWGMARATQRSFSGIFLADRLLYPVG